MATTVLIKGPPLKPWIEFQPHHSSLERLRKFLLLSTITLWIRQPRQSASFTWWKDLLIACGVRYVITASDTGEDLVFTCGTTKGCTRSAFSFEGPWPKTDDITLQISQKTICGLDGRAFWVTTSSKQTKDGGSQNSRMIVRNSAHISARRGGRQANLRLIDLLSSHLDHDYTEILIILMHIRKLHVDPS